MIQARFEMKDTGLAIMKSRLGKWCILQYVPSDLDTGSIYDLTDKQKKGMIIETFDTQEEAFSEYNKMLMEEVWSN